MIIITNYHLKQMIIAVLDSGYSGKQNDRIIGGIAIAEEKGKIVLNDDYSDLAGHGTAVIDLLISQCPEEIKFFVVRILDGDESCNSRILLSAFSYILEKNVCDLIHISAGVERLDEVALLQKTITQLFRQGIYVIAAFSNNGCLSYPAAFKNVIGVDVSNHALKKSEFESVDGSIVNFRTSSSFYRVNWFDKKIIINGSSFSCTLITAKAVQIILKDGRMSFNRLIDRLKQDAVFHYDKRAFSQLVSAKTIAKDIKKAIVFPFNKEVFQIAGNEELCNFTISGYYTHKYDINVGNEISTILKYSSNKQIVQSIDTLNWQEDFDTVILGHCNEISSAVKKDIALDILSKACQYHKNVYSFANVVHYLKELEFNASKISFPYIDISHKPQNRFGKLRKSGKPIIAVYGTSSKQGKFHVQLSLRSRFQKDGYRLFQISTEPTGYLFGMDCVFPIGYESTFYLNGADAILTMNDVLEQADQEEADIILLGSQSGTVPYSYDNIQKLTMPVIELTMAINPDAVILCINYDDSVEYISRTKMFIENLTTCKIIAFCMLPVKYERSINTLLKKPLEIEEIETFKTKLRNRYDVPLFIIGDKSEMDCLYQAIIDFFDCP